MKWLISMQDLVIYMPHSQHKLIVNDSGINEYDIMRWIINCAYILLRHSKPTYYVSFVVKNVDN